MIDGDPAFRLGLKHFLREYVGFDKIFAASNGEEALETIRQEESIELMTIDSDLTKLSGLQVLAELKEDSPRPIAATMITADRSLELKDEFQDLTSSRLVTKNFVNKPVDFEELEPLILRSYEELKASQRLTETMTGAVEDDVETVEEDMDGIPLVAGSAGGAVLASRLDSMDRKLDQNNMRLEQLASNKVQFGFWLSVLRWLAVAAVIFVLYQLGFVQKAASWIESKKSAFQMAPAEVEQVTSEAAVKDENEPVESPADKPVEAEVKQAPVEEVKEEIASDQAADGSSTEQEAPKKESEKTEAQESEVEDAPK
ncbi:MAG: response regulator, partial [Verrucomicrobiota bacterium]